MSLRRTSRCGKDAVRKHGRARDLGEILRHVEIAVIEEDGHQSYRELLSDAIIGVGVVCLSSTLNLNVCRTLVSTTLPSFIAGANVHFLMASNAAELNSGLSLLSTDAFVTAPFEFTVNKTVTSDVPSTRRMAYGNAGVTEV